MILRVPITANALNPMTIKMPGERRSARELPSSLRASTDDAEYTISNPKAQIAIRHEMNTRRGRIIRAGTPAISFSPNSE